MSGHGKMSKTEWRLPILYMDWIDPWVDGVNGKYQIENSYIVSLKGGPLKDEGKLMKMLSAMKFHGGSRRQSSLLQEIERNCNLIFCLSD